MVRQIILYFVGDVWSKCRAVAGEAGDHGRKGEAVRFSTQPLLVLTRFSLDWHQATAAWSTKQHSLPLPFATSSEEP